MDLAGLQLLFFFVMVKISDSGFNQEVFLLIERKTNEQIAASLSLAPRSVENYLSRIYLKTGCPGHEALLERYG